MSKTSTQKIVEILNATEKIADEILVNKQEIIALDKRRQQIREAIREIQKTNDEKSWIVIGSMLIKTKRNKALELLKNDQVKIDNDINKLRSEQKSLMAKLSDLEFSSPLRGMDLKPLNQDEISALKANF